MRNASERIPAVAVVHHDRRALLDLTVTLSGNGFSVTAIESSSVLEDAQRALAGDPHAVIVALTGHEDAGSIERFATEAGGRAIFMAAGEMHAAEPDRESTVLAAGTSGALIVATLIALLAARGVAI